MSRTLTHRTTARALLLTVLAVASFAAVAVAATINGTSGPDFLVGTSGNDTINGFGSGDVIYANAGVDNVKGGTGGDVIHGGLGNDRLDGEDGDDLIFGDGNNVVCPVGVTSVNYCSVTPSGTAGGDDVINGGNGNDELYGGAGNDRIDGG